MSYVTIENQQVFYTRAGNGRPLLLIHGAGGSRLHWPAALRRLPNADVITLDLPGHGRSDPPGRSSIEAYADLAIAFIHALELEDVTVLGHSMGGAIAQMVGLKRPSAVSRLILLGTGAALPVSDVILEQTLTDYETAVAFVTKYSWAKSAPAELITAGAQIMSQTDPQIVYDDFMACNAFDIRERLAEMSLPTHVISGSVDRMTPEKYGRYLADHIPNARLTVIEGGGHMMALEQPAQIAEIVKGVAGHAR